MSYRRGGSRAQSRGPRRISDWGLGPSASDQSVSTGTKTLWSTGTAPSQNLTVVRTRGFVRCILQTAGAAADGFALAHGIYMATEDAFAVGVTAMLDPFADASSDMWLWHSWGDVRSITATIADGVNAFSVVHQVEIDSKAMRKDFDSDRVMVGITGHVESGTASFELHANTRQLFLT